MAHFRIKATAKADLKGIAQFTEKTWGREQRNRYLTELDDAFHRLAENNALGKACDHIKVGYQAFPVGSPVIFYKTGDREIVDIIRALHKRMDVSPRLFKA